MLTDRVEDDVVSLAVLGEIFLCVVDHAVRSERSQQLEVFCAAYRGDVGAEGPGQLYSRGADCPRRAVDEDPAPLAKISLFQTRQGVERAVADWRSLLEAHTGRHVRDAVGCRNRQEFRVRPEPEPGGAEDLVADRELADGCPDGVDGSGEFRPENPVPRPSDT